MVRFLARTHLPGVGISLISISIACVGKGDATGAAGTGFVTSGTLSGTGSGAGGANGSGATHGPLSGPCDPLSPASIMLSAVIGAAHDGQGTLYLADRPSTYLGRVFVSAGSTLYRQHVAGGGERGTGANADYIFVYSDPSAATEQNLLIQVRAGNATAMALGPTNSKAFIGDPGSEADTPLTLVDASVAAGLALQNLPGVVLDVADVEDGSAIAITEPMDAEGSSEYRLFYGEPSAMTERDIVGVGINRSGAKDISFAVDGATYAVHFTIASGDAGRLGEPGPGRLDTNNGTKAATQRVPTPPTLSGFAFNCFARP